MGPFVSITVFWHVSSRHMFWVTQLQDGAIPIDVDLCGSESFLLDAKHKQETIFCDIQLLGFGGQFVTWLTEHINASTKQVVYIQLMFAE